MLALSTINTPTASIDCRTPIDSELDLGSIEREYWSEVSARAPRAIRVTSLIGLLVVLIGFPGDFFLLQGHDLQIAWIARAALATYFVASWLFARLAEPVARRGLAWWVVSLMLAVSGAMSVIGVLSPTATHWYFLGVIEAEIAAATFLRIPRHMFLVGMLCANLLYAATFTALAEQAGNNTAMVAVTMAVMAVLVGFAQSMILSASFKDFAQRVALRRAKRNVRSGPHASYRLPVKLRCKEAPFLSA